MPRCRDFEEPTVASALVKRLFGLNRDIDPTIFGSSVNVVATVGCNVGSDRLRLAQPFGSDNLSINLGMLDESVFD